MVLADGSLELKLYFDVPVAETDGSDEVRQEPKRSRKGAEKEPKRSRRVPKRSRKGAEGCRKGAEPACGKCGG